MPAAPSARPNKDSGAVGAAGAPGPLTTAHESAPPSMDTPVPGSDASPGFEPASTPASGGMGPHLLSIGSQTPDAQTSIATAAVHVDRPAGLVGSGLPFWMSVMQVPAPASVALHHWPAAHWLFATHADPHVPVTASQIWPSWPTPLQSVLFTHFPHPPPDAQNGADVEMQGMAPLLPRSPVHAPHVFADVLQSGVVPVHALVFAEVHATHVLVDGEQAGVAPLQFESLAQPSHFPPAPHTPDRHSAVPASPDAHMAPLGRPHSLSDVAHTPLTHARVATADVHVPPGTGCPLATSAWQTPVRLVRLSHHCPAPQIASVVHVFPHAPIITSHRGPAWVLPTQSASVVHTPHVPAAWQ